MDQRVLQTQEWLNDTYTGVSGYTPITEDGATGHATFTALIKALQIELGITVDGVFGPGTLSACPATISQVEDVETATPCNLHYIIQGSMWCKGYNPGGFDGIFGPATASGIIDFQADAGITQDGIVRPYILQAIMNTDGYALDEDGDINVQTVQQDLNNRYGATIGLSPSNGIWGRKAHQNLIKSAQIEWGATPVDGIFGSGTLALAPTLSINTSGYTASKRILQWALCVNGYYPGGFTGTFGTGTYNAVYNFQDFSCIGADGIAGKKTWASLMISCGDTTRQGTACDCVTRITTEKAAALVSAGYTAVGRYLTNADIPGALDKRLTADEIEVMGNAGLRVFPIFQTIGNEASYFTNSQGMTDMAAATNAAQILGFPDNTIIYFAIDFDALDEDIESNVLPYFQGINDVPIGHPFRIGVYGTRNVCRQVAAAGYSCSSFVSDMSSGYSGNLGFALPTDWAFDQIVTKTVGTGDGAIQIDNNICYANYHTESGRDQGVLASSLIPYCGWPDHCHDATYHNMVLQPNGNCVCSVCGYTVSCCGWPDNYQDATYHHMVDQQDGFYECTTCGYKVQCCGWPDNYQDATYHNMVDQLDGHYVCTTCGYDVPCCGWPDNYQNVFEHDMVSQSDGYYECTACGYRIPSPGLQDEQIMYSNIYDYHRIIGLLTAYAFLESVRTNDSSEFFPLPDPEYINEENSYYYFPERCLLKLDKIRSSAAYSSQYSYCDGNGNYANEFAQKYSMLDTESLNNELFISSSQIDALSLPYYNGLLAGLIDFGKGLFIDIAFPEYAAALALLDSLTRKDLVGIIGSTLDYLEIGENIGNALDLIEIFTDVDYSLAIGDYVVEIKPLYADDLLLLTIFLDSNHAVKSIKWSWLGE